MVIFRKTQGICAVVAHVGKEAKKVYDSKFLRE